MATVDHNTPANADRKKPMSGLDLAMQFEKDHKLKEEMDDQLLLLKVKNNYQIASEARKRYDWEWLSRDLFRRGYQFSKYNAKTRTVTMATSNVTKIPINLTAASMRVIKNSVTVFRPKWEVLPNNEDDNSKTNARFAGKTLDYVHLRYRLKKVQKETVGQGLLYSVGGPWQIGWDPEVVNEDGTKGFIYIWLLDPFDFYVDPNCTDGLTYSDAQYVVKAVRKSVMDIKNNPMYHNTEGMIGDTRLAASEYKQFLIQSIKQNVQMQTTEESQTVILKEAWMKEYDDKGKMSMRVVSWIDTIPKPLRNEIVNEEDFPFRGYQADMNPLEVYGEGWARHVIPVNKVLNALESSIFDYNYKYAKGRIVVDKNSGVRVITNEHGSIIEKNRGADVHSLPLQPLPNNAEAQVQRMRQYFEDLSGAHDVSLGRIPSGVKSGIGIAELKQADATNQDDLVDNLEDFLVEVGKKVLNTISKYMDVPHLIKATNIVGKAEYFAIVGSEAGKGRSKKNTYKIGKSEYPLVTIEPNNSITVQVGSWLAYSKQQRQQELKDLYTTGVIDARTLLEHLEFGDIDTILTRRRYEDILKSRRDTQGINQTPITEEELALSETQMLLTGDSRVTAQPQDDHKVHIAVHQENADNEMVSTHIEQHQMYLDQANNPEPAPNTPAVDLGAMGEVMPNVPQAGPALPPPPVAPPVPELANAVPSVQGVQ